MNQTMQIEIDMLKGDINRMCVTTDKEELKRERDWAKLRIDNIFNYYMAQILLEQGNNSL